MNIKKFVAYYRVSTVQQGKSGLGLDAQKETVMNYLNGGDWELLAEFTEVESGTSKNNNTLSKRPMLKQALDYCKKQKATLVIAKLDRLARNVHFISGLLESGIKFVAADFPEANELTIHLLSVFAQHETKMISTRTKDALAQAKLRGVKLGNPRLDECRPVSSEGAINFANELKPILTSFISNNYTQRQMVEELNKLNIKTSRGNDWSQIQLQRTLKRLNINTIKS